MPQISLYVTQRDLAKIENAAAKEKKSISKWVVTKIFEYLEPSYPAGYEKLAGCIRDENFRRPDQSDFSKDAYREMI